MCVCVCVCVCVLLRFSLYDTKITKRKTKMSASEISIYCYIKPVTKARKNITTITEKHYRMTYKAFTYSAYSKLLD